jgi:transcriptional regulator with XRE-family HTH domain
VSAGFDPYAFFDPYTFILIQKRYLEILNETGLGEPRQRQEDNPDGRGSREIPAKLGMKLAKIRDYLGVSQDGLVRKFGLSDRLMRIEISKYERGVREPALAVFLKYARAADVNVEVLMDDDLKLSSALLQRRLASKERVSAKKRPRRKRHEVGGGCGSPDGRDTTI